MTFAHPWRLALAAAAVLAFLALYRYAQERKTGREHQYTHLPFLLEATNASDLPWRWLLAGWLLGVALLASAFAGPRLPVWVPIKDAAIAICIDTSGSMAATDVRPSRAAAARAAAQAFIEGTPPGTRIAIVAFATQAALMAPLTADRTRLQLALEELPTPNGATAIGDALALAAQQLPPRADRAILLVTDGVNNSGIDPLGVAQRLGTLHVPVYAVGIGTNGGALIPGTAQSAGIDERALRSYALASGGAYARAADAKQLRQALAQLGRSTTVRRRVMDVSFAAAVLGGLTMLLTFVVGFAAGRYP